MNLAHSVDPNILLDLNESDENTSKISYVHKQVFKCFEKIEIICEQIGNIDIKGYNEEG